MSLLQTRHDRTSVAIEPVLIEDVPGGFSVLARAWGPGNKQIGFGRKGDVDLERFMIIGLPLLIEDPLGSVVRHVEDEATGKELTYRFREDPEENLLRRLERAIALKTLKHGSDRIVAKREGHTTLSVSSQPGTGTAPIDGFFNRVQVNGEVFSGIRGNTPTAATMNSTASVNWVQISAHISDTDEYTNFRRSTLGYPTGTIGSDEIVSAQLEAYVNGTGVTLGDDNIVLVSHTLADESTAGTSDGVLANFGTVDFGTRLISGLTTAAMNIWTLTPAGLAYINKAGNTILGVRFGRDISDTAPTWSASGQTSAQMRFVDFGDDTIPVFTVEHEAPSAGFQPAWASGSNVLIGGAI